MPSLPYSLNQSNLIDTNMDTETFVKAQTKTAMFSWLILAQITEIILRNLPNRGSSPNFLKGQLSPG